MKHPIRWSLLALLTGCTAFEGVEPGGAPAGGASGAAGSGGDGGSPAQTCIASSPSCLLPELEAVRLCARVAVCPTLATAIMRATAIPVAEIDETGERTGFNFSACVDWLTGPLEDAHPGFERVREKLNCVIATSSCEKAESCLAFAPLPIDLDSCDTSTCETFGLDCADQGCATAGVPPLCDVPFGQDCAGGGVTSCALERADGMWLAAHIDCGKASQVCVPAGFQARCEVEGAACTQLGESNSCQTAEEIRLCLRGSVVEFDCAKVGLQCVNADLDNDLSGRCE